LVILFRLFDFLAPKDFKVIWASNLLTRDTWQGLYTWQGDKGYSRNVSFTLQLDMYVLITYDQDTLVNGGDIEAVIVW
jgi:hypothetical protein